MANDKAVKSAPVSSSQNGSVSGKGNPALNKNEITIGIIAAVVVVLIVILAIAVPTCSNSSGSGESDYDTPTNAYDIAGVLGMKPSEMMTWLNSDNFVIYDGGGNAFTRVLTDGTKEVPASTDPSENSDWQTLAIQGCTFFSTAPAGLAINNVFDNPSCEISASSLPTSKPIAVMYIPTD